MAAEQIEGARWAPYFANLTDTLVGEQTKIEVALLGLGDQTDAEWALLIDITYHKKGDLIEIHLEDLNHLIRSPREVLIDYASTESLRSQSTTGDGNRQIVRLKDSLPLPAPGLPATIEALRIPVLLNVAPDGRQESRLVKCRGHVTCLQIVGTMSAVPDPATATTEAEALLESGEVKHEFRKTVDAARDGARVDWALLCFYGDPATILIECSRFADLIGVRADDAFRPIACVALHTRTSVLAVWQRKRNFVSSRCWK
jgi:hypothetical protein